MSDRPLTPPPPPQGFTLMKPPGAFVARAAYFFQRIEDDEAVAVGTWITSDQSNSAGVAHGGFLLAFADFTLSYVLSGITLNLSVDFLRAVPEGNWLEARVSARRRSDQLIFADSIATTNGKDALRISGLFRPVRK